MSPRYQPSQKVYFPMSRSNVNLSTAFVSQATPMFSDLLQRLKADETLSAVRKRDMASGLRRVAKALALPPEAIPAELRWLQPRLARIAAPSMGLTDKSWSNAISDARAALAHLGCVGKRIHQKANLSPEWRSLWDAALASGDRTIRTTLSPFVYFLNSLGVAPEDVSDDHAAIYRAALAEDHIRKSPEKVFKQGIHAWNMAVRMIEGWPQQRLVVPTTVTRIKLPLRDFPASLREDLDGFYASLAHPNPLDPEAISAPLREGTVQLYGRVLVRFASSLVHAGIPIDALDSLAAVVEPKRAELGLRWMLQRVENKTTVAIEQAAKVLKLVARRYVRSSEADQKQLDRMGCQLAMKKSGGMTSKNRERLRPLDDEATLRRLLLLPEELFARAEARGDAQASTLEREDALAIGILLVAPIRRCNLASIHLDNNLDRPGDGSVYLHFSENEVKNYQRLEFRLPPEVVKMIGRHLATRAPRLCPPATPWLFPARDGRGPMHPDGLSKRIRTRIHRETGLTINPHLFRHIAAKLMLDAHPGGYESVRHLLGHSRLSTTLTVYTGLEAGTAARLFADVVEAARRP